MSEDRKILFYLYEGFEPLDVAGPASVFNAANILAKKPLYSMGYVAKDGGMMTGNSGLPVFCERTSDCLKAPFDTLLFPGGDARDIGKAIADESLIRDARDAANAGKRIASVCAGAFLLAATGHLDGRRATTHWAGRKMLKKLHPALKLAEDVLYVTDGPYWTSAGATAGIDMTLALLKEDHGPEMMRRVAQWLVLYAHRPGRQSQFSRLLSAQTADNDFSDLILWMHQEMSAELTVPLLADRAGMSERTFYRRFTKAVGETPARFLDGLRLERAKILLEEGCPVKQAAHAAGYRTESGFRTAFEAAYGLTPSLHRLLHGEGENGEPLS